MKVILALMVLATASAKTYFTEKFEEGWKDRWVVGVSKGESEMGEWKWTAGKHFADEEDKGLQTGEDAKFYSISAKMDEAFVNKGKDLVIQYTVKHEQDIDCGGAYIKLLPGGFDQAKFSGDDKYNVMFGPDICGSGTRKTHAIFRYGEENLLTKREISCESDVLSHVYTMIVKPDNTYVVKIDNKEKESGSMFDHWDFLAPKEIKDPEESKPTDWVDEKKIPDPEDIKPEGYDDIPEQIPDPEAEKPEDWDDEDDGEWEPPMIDNAEYKGEWSANMIKNPEYKGEWEHPLIANPDFVDDKEVHARCTEEEPCEYVGFELWQVKAGTIFDDIIVTDSVEEAEAFYEATHGKKGDKEKKMMEDEKKEKKKAEEAEKKIEEAAAKAAKEAAADAAENDDEDDDYENDDAVEDKIKSEL